MTVLRFAPSPNGELHLGHAYSALLNAELARRMSGRMLLRIEDIDAARCRPEYEARIYDDLAWLGLEFETPVRRQSEHFADYAGALDRLEAQGLVYPAFMSRGEVRAWIADKEAAGKKWPRDPDGASLYPPIDRGLSDADRKRRIAAGDAFAWRLDMDAAITTASIKISPTPNPSPQGGEGHSGPLAKSSFPLRGGGRFSWCEFDPDASAVTAIEAHPERWGDVVIARSDTPTSYHLSVVVDDALQGVTHVVRGKDLYEATSVHRLLQRLLELPEPIYHHHRLILDEDGHKLSKSERSSGIRTLREAGKTPAHIRAMVGL